ncbi:uncharacterized protein LOC109828246, partial [Asparagus officinalis]|uniref:uncharacterized protein LOC109828246 n=1 Tax=Asparagus officinalis TaxID=4686 RepID=UPI00098DFEE4
MYNLRKGSKTSRLKGIDEFLSIENQSAGQEEEQTAEPAPGEEQRVVDPPVTRAAGKRKLSADEAGQYDKQIRRKLLVDSPPKGQQKSKFMADALKAAEDDEPQESSVAALISQAGDLMPSPTTGPMKRPAAGASLPEPSATRDDEERVDYEDSSIGDAADEDRGDEDADAGNMSGGGEDDEEHDSIDDITTFDDAPKVPSDKVSGYTPFHISGSPSPGTTATAASEPEPAQVSAPLEEQHLPGSPT